MVLYQWLFQLISKICCTLLPFAQMQEHSEIDRIQPEQHYFRFDPNRHQFRLEEHCLYYKPLSVTNFSGIVRITDPGKLTWYA